VRALSFAREVEEWVEPVIFTSPEIRIEETTTEPKPFDPLYTPDTHAPIRENPIKAPPVPLRSAPPPEASVKSAVKLANATFTYEDFKVDVIEPPPPVITETESLVETEETPEPESFVAPTLTPLNDITIETELGGLFYLINLALFMEIYSDFTSPVESFHDDLSIWDFVMIVGREINQDRDLEDPIWTGLQDLRDVHDNPENPEILSKPEWLTDLLPHLRARLILALGIDSEDSLADILLHHHARVAITPTHLDIYFSLADHPIELRLSGLDRNPGWVPAAGRFIAFHYD